MIHGISKLGSEWHNITYVPSNRAKGSVACCQSMGSKHIVHRIRLIRLLTSPFEDPIEKMGG